MNKTGIPWCTHTVSPIVGCTKCSPGCRDCWAEIMAKRIKATGHPAYQDVVDDHGWTGRTAWNEKAFQDLLHVPWKGKRVFVGSMTDLFHESVTDECLDKIIAAIALHPQHNFMLLTKRPKRMREYLTEVYAGHRKICDEARKIAGAVGMFGVGNYLKQGPLPNLILMTTVCNQEEADRNIPALLDTPAWLRGVSVEPMLGEVDLSSWIGTHNCHICYSVGIESHDERFFDWQCEEDEQERLICPRCGSSEGVGTWKSWMGRNYDGSPLDWVICGCEQVNRREGRHMDIEWTRSLRDQCVDAGVQFFLKQAAFDGTFREMPEIDGKVWDQMPGL